MRRFVSAGLVMAIAVTAGCSSSSDEHCDSAGAARLCVVSKSAGAHEIKGSGLQPGSTITATLNGTSVGPTVTVRADGTLSSGTFGLLGGLGGELVVTGVGASGQPLRVALHTG